MKPLRSRPGFRRCVGDYRVIFERDDKTRTISGPQVILVIPMYAGYGGMGRFAGEPRQTVVMPSRFRHAGPRIMSGAGFDPVSISSMES